MNIRIPDSLQTVPDALQNFPKSMRQTNPRTRLILSLIGIAAAVAFVWYLVDVLSAPPAHVVPPPPVRVGTVSQMNVVATEQTIGTIVANATVQVTSRVDGQIDSAAFTEGQTVHQGDVLFRLDPKPFQAALIQAQATTARDAASLTSAQNDAKRYSALAKIGAASASQGDTAVAQAKALAATVNADRALANIAALNLQWSVIRSPVDGKTGPILVQPGNLVKANDTNSLLVITQIHPVKVSFFLPQSDLPAVQDRLKSGQLTVQVQVHGASQTRETAKVDFVGNAVSSTTGTIELRATFPNTDDRLVPGQVVDVAVALNNFNHALIVPHDAVNVGPDGRYVYAVRDSKAQLIPVSVLYDGGTYDAVTGKLKTGETLITDGQLRVEPGKPVSVLAGTTKSAAAAQ